jgi:hypothetical protein
LNHLQAAQVGQSGILMGVHPDLVGDLTGGLAISSLSKLLRLNTRNNLLNLQIWAAPTRGRRLPSSARQMRR